MKKTLPASQPPRRRCILQRHPEFQWVWMLVAECGRMSGAFVPALQYPAPPGASQDDLDKLAGWMDGAF